MFHFVLCSVFAVFFDIFLEALSSKYWQCIQCEFWRDLPDCFSGLLHVAFPSRQPLSNMSWLSMSVMHLRARQTITHTTRMTSSHYDCGIRLITKIFRASAFAASSDFSRASFSASHLWLVSLVGFWLLPTTLSDTINKKLRNFMALGGMKWVKAGFIQQSQSSKTNAMCQLKAHAGTRRNVAVGRFAYRLAVYKRYIQQNPKLYHAVSSYLTSRAQIFYQKYPHAFLAISCNVHPKIHSLSSFHCIGPLYLLSLRLQRKCSHTLMDSMCSL